MDERPVVIAGAGPGGLACGVALTRVGVPVVLLERAPQLRCAGAGLTVQINAMRMLALLGLDEAICEAGELLSFGRLSTWRGELLTTLPLGEASRHLGQPGVAIHRFALSQLLAAALPEGAVRDHRRGH